MKSKIKFWAAALIPMMIFTSCGEEKAIPDKPCDIDGLAFEERAELLYADCFAIDRYSGGYSMIYAGDGGKYLIVPENGSVPEMTDESVKIINQPAENIYLAATSVMGLFDAVGCADAVRFSGTEADGWYIDHAREAMENGDMIYAGKYSEPDYELLVSENCRLSIQSTMIGHAPEVKEKLEELGITVFVDYSSYESHPLGRSEWIKVYGEITGRREEAESLFSEQAAYLDLLNTEQSTGKTAAFFYISTSGQAVTRKPGDYVTKMIELAGGENIFSDLGNDNASSSVTMEMEEFYTTAKDADFIIYNISLGGEINTVDDLIAKNALLADFKAVKEGNVWCTKRNFYQETLKLGAAAADLHSIFSGNADNCPPQFFYKLESGESR